MRYLVTGVAGFIGFHVAKKLLEQGHEVVGIDNLNDAYVVKLKEDRLNILKVNSNFIFYKIDISNKEVLEEVFERERFDKVCHLAGQAGVRQSIEDPFSYEKSNILGFLNLLECLKKYKIMDLVYASSSSTYGMTGSGPYSEEMKIDKPMSIYAATKATNELFAHVYYSLYGMNIIGFRFFTVYGPWGRPDMSYFLFADSIVKNKSIKVFNFGKMKRDFTYIDDIVSGVCTAMERIKTIKYGVYNLGGSHTVELLDFISIIEKEFDKKVEKVLMPLQQGDMIETSADITKAEKDLNYEPKVRINEGLKEFVKWYKSYYQI